MQQDLSPGILICRRQRLTGIRTLRRGLKLAVEWGKLEKEPKIVLAKGEKQRKRIVTEDEVRAYLDCSQQPWRDVATLLYATGMRPGEAYRLRWERVLLNCKGGLLQVADGKSRAARRHTAARACSPRCRQRAYVRRQSGIAPNYYGA